MWDLVPFTALAVLFAVLLIRHLDKAERSEDDAMARHVKNSYSDNDDDPAA